MCDRTGSNGSSVRLSSKFLRLFRRPPRRREWRRLESRRTPRAEARRSRSSRAARLPLAARIVTGRSDSNTGRAMQAPRPRRKWRRLRARARCSAVRFCGFIIRSLLSARSGPGDCELDCSVGGERRVFWKGAEWMTPASRAEARPSAAFECVHNPVYRLHVIIIQPATERVGQQLLGQSFDRNRPRDWSTRIFLSSLSSENSRR